MDNRCFGRALTLVTLLFTSNFAAAAQPQCTSKDVLIPEVRSSFREITFDAAVTPTQKYAAKLFTHLAGSPVPMTDPRFRKVVRLVEAGDLMGAARVVQAEPNFLKVRARNFSIPFIDKDHRPKDTLTDLQTLIIGVIRDDMDARNILTGDIAYVGYPSLGLPMPSRANNDHYAQFEARDLDFDKDMVRLDQQWPDLAQRSGALTTRAWAEAYYNGGTNRLAVEHAIQSFQCFPRNAWRLRGNPDWHVRRDIDRAPGGDPSKYQNDCRGCHAHMDAIGGAFAHLDFVSDELIFKTDGVVDKMNKNGYYFPAGYVTTDDSWVNLFTNHNLEFGWRGPKSGMGVASVAKLFADSRGFSRCMVQKTFSEVCGKVVQEEAPQAIDSMVNDFEQSGYKLKELFAKVAIMKECIDHPSTEVK